MWNYAYLFIPPPNDTEYDQRGVCVISDVIVQLHEYVTLDILKKNYDNCDDYDHDGDHWFIMIYLAVQR